MLAQLISLMAISAVVFLTTWLIIRGITLVELFALGTGYAIAIPTMIIATAIGVNYLLVSLVYRVALRIFIPIYVAF